MKTKEFAKHLVLSLLRYFIIGFAISLSFGTFLAARNGDPFTVKIVLDAAIWASWIVAGRLIVYGMWGIVWLVAVIWEWIDRIQDWNFRRKNGKGNV